MQSGEMIANSRLGERMKRSRFSLFSVFALSIALVAQAGPASALPTYGSTFTDSVSVTDYLGHPLPGATVAFAGYDDSTQKNYLSSVTTTDSQGIAHLTGKTSLAYWGISVTPGLANNDNAATTFTDNMWLQNYNQTVAIQLKHSTALVHPENSDGTDAAAGVDLNFPAVGSPDATDWVTTARSGVVGIDLSDQLSVGQNLTLMMSQSIASNAPLSAMQVSVVGKGVGSVAGLATIQDPTIALPLDSTGASILRFSIAQVHGQLYDSSGAVVALPFGVTASVRVRPATTAGEVAYENSSLFNDTYARVHSDGSFTISASKLGVGKYFPDFAVSGSATIGSFVGAPFWVLSDGTVSATANGPGEPMTTFALHTTVPSGAPTLVLKSVAEDGISPVAEQYIIQSTSLTASNGNPAMIVNDWAGNGIASAYLAPGDYTVMESPSDRRLQFFMFNLTVNQDGSLVATDQFGNALASPGGVVEHVFKMPNLVLNVSNPGSSTVRNTQACVNVNLVTGGSDQFNCVNGSWMGYPGFYVSDGAWNINLNSQDGINGGSHYTVTVSGPNMAVVDDAGAQVSQTDGYFNLHLSDPNFKALFTIDGQPAQSGSYEVQTLDSNGNSVTGSGYGIPSATYVTKFAPGQYRIVFHTGLTTVADNQYIVKVAQDGTVSVDGISPDSNGVYILTGAQANVTATVVDPQGNALVIPQNAGVSVCLAQRDSNGNWNWNTCTDARNGQVALKTPGDGTYRLHFDVYGSATLSTTDSDTFAIDAQHPSAALGAIHLLAANLHIRYELNGVPATKGDVLVETLDSNGNSTGGYGLGISHAESHLHLGPGSYRLTYHTQDANMADRMYLATVAQDGTVTIAGETPDNQGYFTFTGATANVTATILDPLGHTLVVPNNVGVNICLAKQDSNGNWGWNTCRDARGGKVAFFTPSDGTYRLHIDIYGSTELANSDTASFTIDAQHPSFDLGNVQLATPNLKLKFVLNGQPATPGWLEIQKDIGNGNLQWIEGRGFGSPSIAESLPAGTYKFVYHTNTSAMADRAYEVVVAQDLTVSITGVTPDSNGVFVLTGAVPNVTANIVDSQGNALSLPNNVGVNVCLAKQDINGNWGWSSCTSTRGGHVGLKTPADGTYRLHIDVYGTSDFANSDTATFTVDSQHPTFDFGNLALSTPNLKLNFVINGQPATQGSLEVMKDLGNGNFQWVDGRGFSGSGLAENLPAGSYKLTFHTNGTAMADRSYSAVVANDLSVTIPGAVRESNGSFTLTGLVPNLMGTVLGGNGQAVVLGQNQWITACLQKKDQWGNWQWQGCNNVQNGRFLFSTTANGTYRIHLEPNGLSDFAATNLTQVVIDDTNTSFDYGQIHLATPNLKLAFAAPSQATPNGWVQFEQLQSNGNYQWFDSRGFNAPIAENLPTGTYKVTVHLNNANLADGVYRAVVANDGSASIDGVTPDAGVFTLTGATPNVTGSVLDSAGNAIQYGNNKWVNACLQKKDAYGNWIWQACTGLNNGGFAFHISADGTYRVHLDVQGYTASTSTDLQSFDLVGGGPAKDYSTVRLAAPNLLAHLVFANSPLTSANLEIQQPDGNGGSRWVANSNPGTGEVVLNLAAGSYKAVLHTNSSVAADRTFVLTVASDLSVTIAGETVGGDGYFNLAAATPNVTLTVKDPSGSSLAQWSFGTVLQKRNSWGGWDWLNWFNADSNGLVSASVTDPGTYRFRIEPRNVPGAAVTTTAPFTIAAASDTETLGETRLKAPNVQFTLRDPSGNPVPYANVSLQFGNWWTNASSGLDGKVSLFVDSSEIAAANSWASGTVHLHAVVDAPWDRSDIARFECNSGDLKPLCANLPDVTIGTDYSTASIVDVNYAAPNVRITVQTPTGAAESQGAWVVLWKVVCDSLTPANCHREWYAGAVSNQSGVASFNVPDADSALKFYVEVNPSWQNRSTAAQHLDDNSGAGYTLTELSGRTVALLGSNLKLTVLQATAQDSPAIWTGVNIESVDANNNFLAWVAGYGTDNFGKVAIHLNDGRYRITMYPNNGSKGTVTRCIVEVSGGVVSPVACAGGATNGDALTVKLSLGNLVGQVTDGTSGSAIEGAIVVATNTADQSVIKAVSDANGDYGFQVANGSTWDIKVIYVNPDPTAQAYDSATSAGVSAPGDGSQIVQNMQMARKA